jgi:hypothetical protein
VSGYVYALYNYCLRSVKQDDKEYVFIKVGMTTGDPWSRAKELSTTGLPEPYKVVWYKSVENPAFIEKQMHCYLADRRFNKNREFFWMAIDEYECLLDEAYDNALENWDEERVSNIPDGEGFVAMFERLFGKVLDPQTTTD